MRKLFLLLLPVLLLMSGAFSRPAAAGPYNGTAVGNLTYTAAQIGFGQQMVSAGGTAYASLPVPGPFDFTPGQPFTVDFWIHGVTTRGSYQQFWSRSYDNGSNFITCYIASGQPTITVQFGNNYANAIVLITDGAYHHCAAVYNGTAMQVFVDGVGGTAVTGALPTVVNIGNALIGAFSLVPAYEPTGQIDELRVSNVARYTANFTVPSAPYTPDSSTTALYHLDGNLTDSTPTHFTQSAAPGVVFGGAWTTGTGAGHPFANSAVTGNTLDFTATGTACTALVYSNSSTIGTISIDGVAAAALTVPSVSSFQTTPLFSGLSDTAHTVHIVLSAALFLATDDSLAVTGAAPSVGYAPNFGPQAILTATSTDGLGRLGLQNAIQVGGGQNSVVSGNVVVPGTDGCVRFTAQAGAIQSWVLNNGATLRLNEDGIDLAPVFLPNTGTYSWVLLTSNLPESNAVHTWEINQCLPGGTLNLYEIMVSGSGAAFDPVHVPAARPLWAFYGDSIFAATTGAIPITTQGVVHRLSVRLNVDVANLGVAGSTVTNMGDGQAVHTSLSGQTRTSQATGLSPAPAVVIDNYGTNDFGNGVTTSAFQAACVPMYTSLLAGLPGTTKIYALGILPRETGNDSVIASYNAAKKAAIAQVGSPRIVYLDTSAWITRPIDLLADSVHPTAGGYRKITDALALALGSRPLSITPTLNDSNQKVLTWPPDVAATFYNIYRRVTGTTADLLIGTVAAPTVTFTDTSAVPSINYTYHIGVVH